MGGSPKTPMHTPRTLLWVLTWVSVAAAFPSTPGGRSSPGGASVPSGSGGFGTGSVASLDWTHRSSSGDKMSFGGLWRTCSLNLEGRVKLGRGTQDPQQSWHREWCGFGHCAIFYRDVLSPQAFSVGIFCRCGYNFPQGVFYRYGYFPQKLFYHCNYYFTWNHFTITGIFYKELFCFHAYFPQGYCTTRMFCHHGSLSMGDFLPPWEYFSHRSGYVLLPVMVVELRGHGEDAVVDTSDGTQVSLFPFPFHVEFPQFIRAEIHAGRCHCCLEDANGRKMRKWDGQRRSLMPSATSPGTYPRIFWMDSGRFMSRVDWR